MISTRIRHFAHSTLPDLRTPRSSIRCWIGTILSSKIIQSAHIALAFALCFTASCVDRHASAPSPTPSFGSEIVVDGRFDDWATAPAQIKQQSSLPESEFQIRNVATQHDVDNVYFMVEIDRTLNFQGLEGTLELLFDIDSSLESGASDTEMDGVDLIVQFTPPNTQTPPNAGWEPESESLMNSPFQSILQLPTTQISTSKWHPPMPPISSSSL